MRCTFENEVISLEVGHWVLLLARVFPVFFGGIIKKQVLFLLIQENTCISLRHWMWCLITGRNWEPSLLFSVAHEPCYYHMFLIINIKHPQILKSNYPTMYRDGYLRVWIHLFLEPINSDWIWVHDLRVWIRVYTFEIYIQPIDPFISFLKKLSISYHVYLIIWFEILLHFWTLRDFELWRFM